MILRGKDDGDIDRNMTMNPELLKLISHPLVQEKRGEWKVGDRYVVPNGKVIHFVLSCEDIFNLIETPIAVWIPLPIDPINPKRGVWEWIDRKSLHVEILSGGKISIDANYTGSNDGYFDGDPLTVFLKVFLYQQGVEV